MQTIGFPLTKIQPPRPRSALIERAALERDLGDALASARLVLLAAPAGFGKTAALTRQLAALPERTALAWLAADAEDDLGRFAACLVAALDPHDLPWRVSPDALVAALDADRASRQALLSELLNALDAADAARGLIVIDDAHRIEDPAVFEFLAALVERLPLHWGVVIASRVDPPLPLARWRARGELIEFRQDALRFDVDEVGRLLQSLQAPDHAAEDSATLHERTQGWPAGLGLALSAARQQRGRRAGHRGALSDRLLFDYLASEVLDEMPERLRLFLLRCSVLPELTVSRCAAVSGDAQAAQWLELIERRGLFVSLLDDAERSLRLHDLFRDCLDDRLRRDLPAERPLLLRRAAELEPDAQRRIGYLLRAGDWPAAEADLAGAAALLVSMGAAQQVLRLVEQFPAEQRQASPVLAFAAGLAHWSRWEFDAQAAAMRRAAEGFARRGERRAAERSRAYLAVALSSSAQPQQAAQVREALVADAAGDPLDLDVQIAVHMMRAWATLENSELEALVPAFERLLALLERVDRAELWHASPVLPVYVGLPEMAPLLRRQLAGMLRHVSDQPTPLRVYARALRAALEIWEAQPEAAAEAIAEAEEDIRWLGSPLPARTLTRTFRALLHAWRGEAEPALANARALLEDLELPPSRARALVWRTHYLMLAARVALLVGDLGFLHECERTLRERDWPHEPPLLEAQRRHSLPGHVALLEGRREDAARHYERALADEPILQVLGQAVELRLRLARLQLELGRRDAAIATLGELLAYLPQRARPGAALMAGAETLEALAGADLGDALDATLRRRLLEWRDAARGLRAQAPAAEPPGAAALGALSPRERDVLSRIAAGDSNKLIARALAVSPHTVKRHVANILDKLGLDSRGQAAAWFLSDAR